MTTNCTQIHNKMPAILCSILLCAILVFGGSHLPVSAQSSELGVFFAVTQNSETRAWSIWEASTITGNARLIFNLSSLDPSKPSDVFPEDEVTAFNDAVENGSFLRGTPETPGIVQSIQGIWLVKSNQLLAQISNQVCDRPYHNCYGYYEFLLIDTTTGNPTSLLKIGRRDRVTATWPGCTPNAPVYVDTVLPNPAQDKFVFS